LFYAFRTTGFQGTSNSRLALHVLLLLLTLYSTTLVGAAMAAMFHRNQPLSFDLGVTILVSSWRHPAAWLGGLPYSVTLLTILLAHEMGHYLACRYYRIDATLPYFLPGPTVLGTFGAFIWIRSPIYTKRKLFDVGFAGPIAGFVVLIPALAIGVALSNTSPGIASRGDFVFGTPLLLRFFEWVFLHGIPAADINLHPMARAAWGGLLATALNLLPIGQLDGGHVLYSFFGEKHRWLSRIFTVALIPLGIVYHWWGWFLWAGVLFFLAQRHPVIVDDNKLGPERAALGALALAMFILSFTAVPIS
jgi:membrane-associated protease RseP (regulator of RpoE activity)